jgi:hypothetical protein
MATPFPGMAGRTGQGLDWPGRSSGPDGHAPSAWPRPPRRPGAGLVGRPDPRLPRCLPVLAPAARKACPQTDPRPTGRTDVASRGKLAPWAPGLPEVSLKCHPPPVMARAADRRAVSRGCQRKDTPLTRENGLRDCPPPDRPRHGSGFAQGGPILCRVRVSRPDSRQVRLPARRRTTKRPPGDQRRLPSPKFPVRRGNDFPLDNRPPGSDNYLGKSQLT